MKLENQAAELAWLGTLADIGQIDPTAALDLIGKARLEASDFSLRAAGDFHSVAVDFLRRNVPLDLLAIEAALAPSQAVKSSGGRKWLVSVWMGEHPFETVALEHARIIKNLATRRSALGTLENLRARLLEPLEPISGTISDGNLAWQSLSNKTTTLCTSESDILRLGEMLDAAQQGRRQLVVPTGISKLDLEIGGLQPGVLTMIGALPGVGKSALLASIIRNIANTGTKVGIFSLEDERIWLARRLLSLESTVPVFLLATRPLTRGQKELVEAAGSAVYETLSKVVIDDRPALTPSEVAETARDMIVNHGCKAVLVDHVGEMHFDRGERYDLDIADALSLLRNLAKRYNVPVVVASHVRRRQGLGIEDPPVLTDFANSSAPERMSRVALGLSKPEKGVVRVSVLKQTNGPPGQEIDLNMHEEAAMVMS